jgi:hypothetical protein
LLAADQVFAIRSIDTSNETDFIAGYNTPETTRDLATFIRIIGTICAK